MHALLCVLYLTVESEDPVTMTLSSYCRHNTEPVCPVRIFRHSRLCLSQIYGKQTEVEGRQWSEGHTGHQQQRKRENKRSAEGNKCGSRWERPILSAVFLPHLASLFWTFRSSLRQLPQYAHTHKKKLLGCLPFVPLGYINVFPCLHVNCYSVTSVYLWRHTYLNWIVPKATDNLVIVILETVHSFTIFWATLNPL